MAKHIVEQGECLSSIALQYGFMPDTIWNDPANAQLKFLRKDPNILYPGDEIEIPEREPWEGPRPTDARHKFRLKGRPEILRVRLLDEFDKPRANLRYEVIIDGRRRQGTTNQDGELKEPIPPAAQMAKFFLGEEKEELLVNLGYLDPITEVSGVQARLANLGYDCGPPDGELGPRTREAIKEFQTQHEIEPTGEPDEDTRKKLKEIYGS
jgi:hypothetical protein